MLLNVSIYNRCASFCLRESFQGDDTFYRFTISVFGAGVCYRFGLVACLESELSIRNDAGEAKRPSRMPTSRQRLSFGYSADSWFGD